MTIGRRYSFPNVNVTERIIGPAPFESVWRNTIGVAAPFSKGPLTAAISTRQELVSLFGEDNSIGSTFIRQAMLQGATNFIVSRVMAVPKKAQGVVSIQSGSAPLTQVAVVSNGDNRTVGLKLDFELVSDARVGGPYYVMRQVDSSDNPVINEAEVEVSGEIEFDFEGIGYFKIYSHSYHELRGSNLADYVIPDGGLEVVGDFSSPGANAVQLFTFSKTAVGADQFRLLYPGCTIEAAATNTTAVLASPVEVLSYAFTYEADPTMWAVYVEGTVTDIGDGTFAVYHPYEDVVLSQRGWAAVNTVTFTPYKGSKLPSNIVPLKEDGRDIRTMLNTSNLDSNEVIIGYFLLDSRFTNLEPFQDSTLSQESRTFDIRMIAEDIVDFELINSGIQVKYPRGLAASNRVLTITVLKESISVGETDVNAPNYPETAKAFTPGTTVDIIYALIREAILSNPTLSEIVDSVNISTEFLPYTLTFELKDSGDYGNKLGYTIMAFTGNQLPGSDLVYMDDSQSLFNQKNFLVGGSDGIKTASRIFYAKDSINTPILYIEALSPGFSGNNISVTIRRMNKGRFELEVNEQVPNASSSTRLPTEVYSLSNYSIDLDTGLYPETLDSKMIRAYFIPALELQGSEIRPEVFDLSPSRLAPVTLNGIDVPPSDVGHLNYAGEARLRNIFLEGGSEPEQFEDFIPEERYIDAITRLEDRDVFVISAPGLVASDVRYNRAIETLVNQAQNSTPSNGLRIAILAAPPRLTKSRADIISSTYDTDRLVIVGGWSNLNSSTSRASNSSPEGIYCGRLAVIDTYISPASTYYGGSINGIRSIDTTSDLESLDEFTANNIDMLIFDSSSRSIKFLNGRTTANTLEKRWVAIRRQADHLIMNITNNLTWARSAPNNSETRARVAAACDSILRTERRRGAIADFTPTTIIGSDSLRIAQGYMDVVISWVPVFPADYIEVDITRQIASQFSITTSV